MQGSVQQLSYSTKTILQRDKLHTGASDEYVPKNKNLFSLLFIFITVNSCVDYVFKIKQKEKLFVKKKQYMFIIGI